MTDQISGEPNGDLTLSPHEHEQKAFSFLTKSPVNPKMAQAHATLALSLRQRDANKIAQMAVDLA